MKRGWIFLLIFVIFLLVFHVLKDIDFVRLYELLKNINYIYFGLAFLSCLVSFILWNLRFKNSVSVLVKEKISFFYLLWTLFAGVFINNITPGTSVGGEPIRAIYLSKKYNKPKSNFLGVILADKFIHLSVFAFFLTFSFLFVFIFLNIGVRNKIILEVCLFFIIGLFLLFLFFQKKKSRREILLKFIFKLSIIKNRFKNFNSFKKYVNLKMDNFYKCFKKVFNSKRKVLFGIFISFLFWIFHYLISYFLFLSLSYSVSFFAVIIAVSISQLLGDVSPFPGGTGLVEGTMFVIYSSIGIEPSIAVLVTLLNRAILHFYGLVIGGASFLYLNRK